MSSQVTTAEKKQVIEMGVLQFAFWAFFFPFLTGFMGMAITVFMFNTVRLDCTDSQVIVHNASVVNLPAVVVSSPFPEDETHKPVSKVFHLEPHETQTIPFKEFNMVTGSIRFSGGTYGNSVQCEYRVAGGVPEIVSDLDSRD